MIFIGRIKTCVECKNTSCPHTDTCRGSAHSKVHCRVLEAKSSGFSQLLTSHDIRDHVLNLQERECKQDLQLFASALLLWKGFGYILFQTDNCNFSDEWKAHIVSLITFIFIFTYLSTESIFTNSLKCYFIYNVYIIAIIYIYDEFL